MWPGPLASSHAGPPLPQGYHSEGGIAGLTSPNPDGHPGQKAGGWGQLAGQGICSGSVHSPSPASLYPESLTQPSPRLQDLTEGAKMRLICSVITQAQAGRWGACILLTPHHVNNHGDL